ncbi:hypothetical protein CKO28_06000 [Rhodovibrio sodomensis]|uniref:CBS domain-containing protein n=1 Tax=Rhodovibrio sodomensis TaxID=1088 RepID=A0ABS1DAV6_9PROT|nr:hypothetical protein [Rhodovibrio sodomensis]MBK1667584.1 hypothetical protein [Rhodovibrio sodomensis]
MTSQSDVRHGAEFDAFIKRLEAFLKPRFEGPSVGQRLASARQAGVLTRYQEQFLNDCWTLRNLRAHGESGGSTCFAEPAYLVVRRLEEIVRDLEGNPRIALAGDPPKVFQPTDMLSPVLSYMHQQDFSQVPVWADGRARLMTQVGVAKWLEREAGEIGVVELEAATLADVMQHEGDVHVDWARKSISYLDLQRRFIENAARGYRTFAFLITSNGHADGKVVGIVTPWDLFPHGPEGN